MLGLFVARSELGSAPVFWLELAAESLVVMLFTFVMIRFGLLAALVALFVVNVCQIAPLTLDIKHWSSVSSTQTLAFVVALALAAFYASRGDQPLFAWGPTFFLIAAGPHPRGNCSAHSRLGTAQGCHALTRSRP